MILEIINDSEGLRRMKGEWNGLLERSENRDVLHSHQWYACWSDAFIRPADMLVLVAREGERLTAVLPLMKQSYRIKGLAIKAVGSMTNRISVLFDLLSDHPSADLLAALLTKAFEATNRKMMVLEKVQEKSLLLRYIRDAGKKGNFLSLLRPVSEHWAVRMEETYEAFFDSRESKFRRNVRAAERKTMARGAMRVVQPSGPGDLASPAGARLSPPIERVERPGRHRDHAERAGQSLLRQPGG